MRTASGPPASSKQSGRCCSLRTGWHGSRAAGQAAAAVAAAALSGQAEQHVLRGEQHEGTVEQAGEQRGAARRPWGRCPSSCCCRLPSGQPFLCPLGCEAGRATYIYSCAPSLPAQPGPCTCPTQRDDPPCLAARSPLCIPAPAPNLVVYPPGHPLMYWRPMNTVCCARIKCLQPRASHFARCGAGPLILCQPPHACLPCNTRCTAYVMVHDAAG